MIYVRISLVGINWMRKQKTLFKWMEWITLGIVLALAVGSFIAATHEHHAKNVMLNNNIHRFLLGLMLSAISPMQIPFWFGWSTVLFTKKILQPKNSFYNLYIVGIGLGTLMGNCVFIFGGKYIVEKLNTNQNILNWVIGGIFALTAVIQFIRILMHKDAIDKMNKFQKLTLDFIHKIVNSIFNLLFKTNLFVKITLKMYQTFLGNLFIVAINICTEIK